MVSNNCVTTIVILGSIGGPIMSSTMVGPAGGSGTNEAGPSNTAGTPGRQPRQNIPRAAGDGDPIDGWPMDVDMEPSFLYDSMDTSEPREPRYCFL